MVITTTQFVDLTVQVAEHLQLPECRFVVVDHPLGGTDSAIITAWADAAVERIMAQFTGQQPAGGMT